MRREGRWDGANNRNPDPEHNATGVLTRVVNQFVRQAAREGNLILDAPSCKIYIVQAFSGEHIVIWVKQ